jgi:hypothetical protein
MPYIDDTPTPLTPIQLAGALPRDPKFREFVSQYLVPVRAATVDEAAAFIRTVCEIESRRELATDAEAVRKFHRYLRKPFAAWCRGELHSEVEA